MKPPTRVIEIATNLDDATGEVVGAAIGALLAAGALDAWVVPATFKKGRPGFVLHLLCAPRAAKRLAESTLELTGSFGCRMHPCTRLVLERRFTDTPTPHGQVRTKVGRLRGRVVAAKAEFDEAKTLAAAAGLPPRRILGAVKRPARRKRS